MKKNGKGPSSIKREALVQQLNERAHRTKEEEKKRILISPWLADTAVSRSEKSD
jgi:hypothetical protein